MMTSVMEGESVLSIDLGTIYTKVSIFDLVEGQYHFIAASQIPSTATAPFFDVRESVFQAIEHLESTTGRKLVNEDSQIIIPTLPDGSGVGRMVITSSTGPEIRVILAGLLPDVSLASARRLVNATYGEVVTQIGLNDRRSVETQIDTVIHANPDLVLLSGGTDQGATRSVLRNVELVRLACSLMPTENRPEVVYAGNKALTKKVKEMLDKWVKVYPAPNIRPTIDFEDLDPAQEVITKVVTQIRYRQIGGFKQLSESASTIPMPTAQGFGRMIRYLSRVYDPAKGVMGIDIGAGSTTIAAADSGKLSLGVLPIGMGSRIADFANDSDIRSILRWLPLDLTSSDVQDYLWQKSLYPSTIPASLETLAIEQAVARHIIRLSLQEIAERAEVHSLIFEPIIASGAILTQSPSPTQSLLMLLDGFQPVGITTFILDQHGLTSSLGAIAKVNQILPVQVLETGSFLSLGTVICPASSAKYGTPIVKVRIEDENGGETSMEIRKGSIVQLPIQLGQIVNVHLQALRSTRIDPRSRKNSASFKVLGGVLGAVIDARGRPLILPSDPEKRRDLQKKWSLALGS